MTRFGSNVLRNIRKLRLSEAEIKLGIPEVAQLRLKFEREKGRKPTDEELRTLVKEYLKSKKRKQRG